MVVAETEDEGILGVDFLSQADSHIDIVKNQVSINEEVFDCSDFKNQPFSSRCVVRRSTIIEPNIGDCPSYYSQALYQLRSKGPVTIHKRCTNLDPKASRVFNVFDEVCNLAAETVVALAKPVVDVTSLKLYEENHERVVGQTRVMRQHVSESPCKNFLEGALST